VKYLIDTDLVIDHFVGRIHAIVLIDALVREGLGISLVTYGELYEGVLGSKRRSIAEAAFLQFLT
jgi:predicted nucleic acid-binding protein